MSATCKNKEGAWAFIRNLLLPGGNTIVENAFGDSYSYIYDIVVEEAGAYFIGDRAVEDVAELIQRRVSLYINESM